MKAIRFHAYGGPEVLRLEEIPVPEIKSDEVLVRVHAAGVNFLDAYQRTGLYKTPMPFGPGMEGAGVIEKAGPATTLKAGTRVAWTQHPGAYAEFAAVPGWKVAALPDEVDDHSGAAALLQGMTAEYLCETTYPAQVWRRRLGPCRCGRRRSACLIQLLKQKGATVYTTVSTDEKATLAQEAGADRDDSLHPDRLCRSDQTIRPTERVFMWFTIPWGKRRYEGSLNVLRPFGMLVLFGQSSGPVAPVDPLLLLQKGSLYFTRPSLTHYVADAASFSRRATKVLNWVAQKSLKLRIEHVYPLGRSSTSSTGPGIQKNNRKTGSGNQLKLKSPPQNGAKLFLICFPYRPR